MRMTATFSLTDVKVETLIKALESFPKDAEVDVIVHSADRWGFDTYSLEVSWTK